MRRNWSQRKSWRPEITSTNQSSSDGTKDVSVAHGFLFGKKIMKSIIAIVLSLFLSSSLMSQTVDTTTVGERSRQRNGSESVRGKMKQGMDRFIDADGDGICDHRAQGLGFRRKGNPNSVKNSTTGTPDGTQQAGKGIQHRRGKQ
jgi:hypothetical protein